MHKLPSTGFLRLPQILGDKESEPPIEPIIPVSKSTWWAGVKTGRWPLSATLQDWRALHSVDGRINPHLH